MPRRTPILHRARRSMRVGLIAAAAATLLTAAPARADLLINGSFENPVVPSTGDPMCRYTNFPAGSTAFTGWTVVGVDPAITNTTDQQNGITFEAQDGQQWLDLAGVRADHRDSGVTQTIATASGSTYHVSFYVGSATDNSLFFASTVDLSVNGGPRMSFTDPTAPTDSLNWLLASYDFIATGTSTTITFLNGDPPITPGGSVSKNFLSARDYASADLVVVPPTGGVPEAHEVALFGIGVLALGPQRRPRSRTA